MAQVVWQEAAIAHLQSIHHYYYEHASAEVAARLVMDIQNAPDILEVFPNAGVEEKALSHLSIKCYYLVVRKRYKIIYMIDGDVCSILAIWDTYRDPKNMDVIIYD